MSIPVARFGKTEVMSLICAAEPGSHAIKIARARNDERIFIVDKKVQMQIAIDWISQGCLEMAGLATVAIVGPLHEPRFTMYIDEDVPDYADLVRQGYRREADEVNITIDLFEQMLKVLNAGGVKRISHFTGMLAEQALV